MKIEDVIYEIPINLTPDNLIALGERLRACDGYEKFVLTSDDDGASILGIREETDDERKIRLKTKRKKLALERYKKEEEQRRIGVILAKNPGVVYHDQPVKLNYTGLAKKLFQTPEAREALALALSEPYGHFTKDGNVISWAELSSR